MKKQIYFLVSLFALIGFSMNVSAETPLAEVTQYNGETKTFTVDSHTDFTYQWYVFDGNSLPTINSSALAGTAYEILTPTANSTQISWKTMATGNYYVAVKESNGTCSTMRYIKVKIEAANYDIIVKAINADGTDNTSLATCMSGEGQSIANDESLNTTKTNVRYYEIAITNNNVAWTGDWTFKYTLTGDDTESTVKDNIANVELEPITGETAGTVTGLLGTKATDASVSVTGKNRFRVKVTAKDNPGISNKFTYTLPLSVKDLAVGAGNVVEKANASANNNVTYTLNTYPNTSTITVN